MPEKYSFTPLGKTDFRNQQTPFFIKDADRLRHLYAIGKTGVGKSTLLTNMAISDIQKGKGCCVLDPHGDVVTTLLHYVPKERIQEVLYLNLADRSTIIPYNPLYNVPPEQHHITAASLISSFKKIWADSWGPRLEYILTQTILSLLWYPKATLLQVQLMLTDKLFREEVLLYVKDMQLRLFWYNEYDKYPLTLRMEAISPILNKMGVFAANPVLRTMMGQQQSINLSEIMDSGKILLCNLSKGAAGEDISSLTGSLLLGAIQQAALKRSSLPEEQRRPFYCYVDECGSFLTTAICGILSEARKYGLSLFLAHQYLDQLPEQIRSAIFGNCGTMIVFQAGNSDAATLAKELYPVFSDTDIIHLPKHAFYIKLMIDGQASKAFSAISVPICAPRHHHQLAILKHQANQFGKVKESSDKEDMETGKQEVVPQPIKKQPSLFE